MKNRLNKAIWGPDLGRVRLLLVYGIFVLSLLGRVSVWAKPELEAWLFPPPPPPPAFCSRVAILLSRAVISTEITAAKIWIREPNTPITFSGLVWDEEDQRVELWMTDGKDALWQIEFVCYKASRGHPIVFGEFEKYSFKEVKDKNTYQESIESLTK